MEQGSIEAYTMLGIFNESGYGMPKNLGYALALYKFAADHGDIAAMLNLSELLIKGGEFGTAKEYLTKARDLGSTEAADRLKKLPKRRLQRAGFSITVGDQRIL